MDYSNTQRAPLGMMLYTAGLATVAAACVVRADPLAMWILAAAGALIVLVGLMFGSLTVRDEGSHLALRYGPLPVFRGRFPYANMEGAEPDRTSMIDGWGIHYVPWRGWTYNLWGFDCVKIRLGKRIVRVGTNDPDGLTCFLRTKIASPAEG